jgi:hypothetical protein
MVRPIAQPGKLAKTKHRKRKTMKIYYVEQNRMYGNVYVKVADRDDTYGTIAGRDVVLSCRGYGRSLQGGGHQYKAYANFMDTGKPVPSKILSQFVEA